MKSKRFRFWNVLWVVLGFYILGAIIASAFLLFTPGEQSEVVWKKMGSLRYLANQSFSLLFSATFYYFMLNVFYTLISAKKTAIHYVRPVVLAVIAIAAYFYLSTRVLFPTMSEIKINNEPLKNISAGLYVFATLFSALMYIGISLLVSYLFYLRDDKKQRKILEEQKMQLEVEMSQANFNFLKAQINPHFLHNTLNFLYAKALPLSPELSEGILTLSDIMRYALSEANAKDGKALLKDEIEHVRNVIKIQQLRFNNQLNVNIEVNGVLNGATIVPFVLITLVENAFKHGDLKAAGAPIDVRIDVEDHKLYFYCRNKKKNGPKELSTGIGLDNIKKRLDLTYGNNYKFNVKDDNEFYTTELTITRL